MTFDFCLFTFDFCHLRYRFGDQGLLTLNTVSLKLFLHQPVSLHIISQ